MPRGGVKWGRVSITYWTWRASAGERRGLTQETIALICYAPRPSILANALLVRNIAPSGSVFRGSGIRFVSSTIASNQGQAVAFFWPTPSLANPPDWRLVRLVNTLVVGNQGGGCTIGAVEGDIEDLITRRTQNREHPIRRVRAPEDGGPPTPRPTPPAPVGIW